MAAGAARSQYRNNKTGAQQGEKERIGVGSMDYTIYLVVVILTLIGVVMVFSASYLRAANSQAFNYDPFYLLKRNALLAGFGFLVMNLAAGINYRLWQKFSTVAYIAALGLLALVIPIGLSTNGAQRWIEVPFIGQFQPSEVAKAGVIFMLANIIDRNNDILKTWKGFFFCMAMVGVMAGLVFYGGLSSAIIVTVIGVGMIFIASPHILRFFVIGGLGAAGLAGGLWLVSKLNPDNFRAGRFTAWLDPFADAGDTGFQVVQSLFAIASGGMFGLGIGQSRQKSFVPEAHNDIIFSIICEEMGFAGAAIVLLLFGILIWRGIRVALNAPDVFSAMTAAGIVLTIASQVIINVAVVTNSIPNTGVTMPFISYGGTSLVVCMGLMGILLSISRYTKES